MVKRIKLRTIFIGGIFSLFFVILISRLFWYQVWNVDFWMEEAKASWSANKVLDSKRGTIYDQQGNVLAMDAPAYTVAVNPKVIQTLRTDSKLIEKNIDVEKLIVEQLHQALGKPQDELYELTRKKSTDGEYAIHREVRNEGWKIDQEPADKLSTFISDLKKKTGKADIGLYLMPDSKRFYAKGNMAAHVLGYLDKEEKPVGGVEVMFDDVLSGQDGSVYFEKDRLGNKLPSASEMYKPAKDGKNVYLTIDQTIQQYIESSMQKVYNQYRPQSITAIAADPKTGNILGMANMPTFDPNEYWEAESLSAFYNHAVQSRYEPGSTFKIVTLAAAVQENIFNPNAYFQSGSIRAGGRRISDHNNIGWGTINYLEGLKRSSNVAFVKLGYEQMEKETFKSYIELFGFGVPTGIELPGENKGYLGFQYPADYAAATYGHGQVTVTPIQQIMAVSAVANGGKLMKPNIVQKIEDPVSGTVEQRKPEMVRQVIDESTAKQVSEYLEQVISDQKIGTGKNAYMESYRAAGKTGTALKVVDGKYDRERAVVSFIGYAPVEDPQIVVLIVVDDPKDYIYAGGGMVAAPMFKDIVYKSLRYMGVPTTQERNKVSSKSNESNFVKAPDVKGLKPAEAKKKLAEQGILYEMIGNGSTIKDQVPKAGEWVATDQHLYLLTGEAGKMSLPDLKGKSLRDVMEICSLLDRKVHVEGEGYVTSYEEKNEGGQRTVYVKLAPKSK
ncbi:penicillin-binding transpeptidase domain-containing protein [Paenibacillus agilis]|uniref:PASTA domain-containing protein n=1 Tax=Paenibacillus agilis TaxID=3020863 RepID=A0A559J2Z8_9BACL|nr:penicillin-binding transpeptidase domain-containing protein [Paenibacillus agilis]TVX94257.1 PASTA domain-containing protein [Paenibacillus agilis]